MRERAEIVVVGAGVIGSSIAFHLGALGARDVLVLDRLQVGAGTTAQSSGILRTHYSVPENVQMARASFAAFEGFAEYVGDEEASSGLVKCGYLIAAPEGEHLAALRESLERQRAMGIHVDLLDRREAAGRLPIARFDDAALIGFEPEAGFADAYLVATGFARAARRHGVRFREGVNVTGLLREGSRIVGVETDQGPIAAGCVISAQNAWTRELEAATGLTLPVTAERHAVFALAGPAAYTHAMPVYKDLGSPGMLYCRSYGGQQMLVSEGITGEALEQPDIEQGNISMDTMVGVIEQVAERFPGWEESWNPVLGPAPGLEGLVLAFGFSGHGFKLSPAVGRNVAQAALGLPTDLPLAPYALERFEKGKPLLGRYGRGAVS